MVNNGARLMSKFTFICEDEPMPFSEGVITKRTVEFDAVVLNDIINEFELFLRGAGFNPSGVLDFVEDNTEVNISITELGKQVMEELDKNGHSEFYFDTERNK